MQKAVGNKQKNLSLLPSAFRLLPSSFLGGDSFALLDILSFKKFIFIRKKLKSIRRL
jgi:hypothetical protein